MTVVPRPLSANPTLSHGPIALGPTLRRAVGPPCDSPGWKPPRLKAWVNVPIRLFQALYGRPLRFRCSPRRANRPSTLASPRNISGPGLGDPLFIYSLLDPTRYSRPALNQTTRPNYALPRPSGEGRGEGVPSPISHLSPTPLLRSTHTPAVAAVCDRRPPPFVRDLARPA